VFADFFITISHCAWRRFISQGRALALGAFVFNGIELVPGCCFSGFRAFCVRGSLYHYYPLCVAALHFTGPDAGAWAFVFNGIELMPGCCFSGFGALYLGLFFYHY